MLANPWGPIDPKDEYAQRDDTHHVHFGKWEYYWSDRTRVLRRYSDNGDYQECKCHRRPMPGEGSSTFSSQLQAIFHARKTRGSLLVDQRVAA